MKHHISSILGLSLLSTALSLTVCAQNSPSGYVDFGKLSPSTSGGEFVQVHINRNLIAMTARLAQKQEPDIAELLGGLQAIQVNVIGLDEQNRAEVEKQVKVIRGKLDAEGWEPVVAVQQKNEDVRVYIKTQGEESVQGLVVTILDGNKQAVLVNIVGDIKPEKVATIGERFNIDPLKEFKGKLHKAAPSEK